MTPFHYSVSRTTRSIIDYISVISRSPQSLAQVAIQGFGPHAPHSLDRPAPVACDSAKQNKLKPEQPIINRIVAVQRRFKGPLRPLTPPLQYTSTFQPESRRPRTTQSDPDKTGFLDLANDLSPHDSPHARHCCHHPNAPAGQILKT